MGRQRSSSFGSTADFDFHGTPESWKRPHLSLWGNLLLLVQFPEPPRVVFCDLCGKTFVTEERMLAHKSYMHPMTIASLPCPKYEKIFESQLAFKKHTTALHQNLVCNECPKILGSSKTLRDHKKRKHSNSGNELSHVFVYVCLLYSDVFFSHMTIIFIFI